MNHPLLVAAGAIQYYSVLFHAISAYITVFHTSKQRQFYFDYSAYSAVLHTVAHFAQTSGSLG